MAVSGSSHLSRFCFGCGEVVVNPWLEVASSGGVNHGGLSSRG